MLNLDVHVIVLFQIDILICKQSLHQGRKSMYKHGGDNIGEKYTSCLLGGFGGMPPPPQENFFKWCVLVYI